MYRFYRIIAFAALIAAFMPFGHPAAQAQGEVPPRPGPGFCGGSEHEPNDKFMLGGGCLFFVNDPVVGTLDPALDRDWFEFQWRQPGKWYLAEVLPNPGVDAWLVVQDHEGARIAFSNNGGPGATEALYFKTADVPVLSVASDPPTYPSYVVGVSTDMAATGGYVLRITESEPPAPTPTVTPVPTETPVPPAPTYPPPPTYPPLPTYPPPPTYPPAPGGGGAPRPTATPPGGRNGTLEWHVVGPAYSTTPAITTLRVQVYYDQNASKGPEPGEGVAGLSVRAVSHGEFVGWGLTNSDGEAEIIVAGPVDRVIVPFLNVQRDIRTGTPGDIVFRLEAVRLPVFLPVKGGQ